MIPHRDMPAISFLFRLLWSLSENNCAEICFCCSDALLGSMYFGFVDDKATGGNGKTFCANAVSTTNG